MEIMVSSPLWVMQDVYHQPYAGFRDADSRLGLGTWALEFETVLLRRTRVFRV